jgi:hypothetical protein
MLGSPERQSAPFSDFETGSSRGWSRSADKYATRGVVQSERGARRAAMREIERSDDRRYSRVLEKALQVGNGLQPTDSKRHTGDPPDPPFSPLRDGHAQVPEGLWTLPSDVTRQLEESPEPLALIYQVTLCVPLRCPSPLF